MAADAPWGVRGFVPGEGDERDRSLHERPLGEEPVWQGGVIRVEDMAVELPDGTLAQRDIVRHPGGVGVVALTDECLVALVRQYRAPFDRVTVEIPAGKIEPGEDPLEAARRELVEETEYTAGELVPLVSVAPSPGYTDEVVRVYLARDLTFTAPAHRWGRVSERRPRAPRRGARRRALGRRHRRQDRRRDPRARSGGSTRPPAVIPSVGPTE